MLGLSQGVRHLNLRHKSMDWSRPRQRAELALMRADYVVNTERWDSGPLQGGKIDLAEARLRDRAVDAFVFGLSAVKRGDRAGAERNLADLVTFSRSEERRVGKECRSRGCAEY